MFTLYDLLATLSVSEINPEIDTIWAQAVVFTKAAVEVQQVSAKSLYIALPDSTPDERQQIIDAFNNGATAALVTNDHSESFPTISLDVPLSQIDVLPLPPFCLKVSDTRQALQIFAAWYRQKMGYRVSVITGNAGKSTTKDLTASIIKQRLPMLRNQRNMNDSISIPVCLLLAQTPETHVVIDIHQTDPVEAAKLYEMTRPNIGVVTNLSPSITTPYQTSSENQINLIKNHFLVSMASSPKNIAVLNYDDPILRSYAEDPTTQTPSVFYYGLNPRANLWVDEVDSDGSQGIRFRVHYQGEALYLRVPLIGRFSVHSAMRAISVGLLEGLTWQDISAGLLRSHSHLQLIISRTPGGALLLDDSYNASPQSMLAALNLLSDMEGRKIAILGNMPESETEERKGYYMVGYRAADICDQLIGVGERAKTIIQAAQRAGMFPSRAVWVNTTEEAIEIIQPKLKEGDFVLIKGDPTQEMDHIGFYLEKSA